MAAGRYTSRVSITESIVASLSDTYTSMDHGWSALGGSVRTTSGEDVTSESALLNATYYACLRNISEDIAKMSMQIFERDGRNKTIDTDHPLWRLLHDEPNPDMGAQQFYESMTHWCLGWGNGYAEIVLNSSGEAVSLWPIHPSRVTVRRDESDMLFYEVRNASTHQAIDFPAWRIFHIKGMGNGYVGFSVFRAAAETLGLAAAVEKFGAAFFANGVTPSGVFKHPEILGDEEHERLKISYRARFGGAEKKFTPLILEEGMSWEPMGVPPNEAQFLETRQFQTVEICRWFRMPPHKVQDLTRSTFSNIESQTIEYNVDTLMPWALRWETEIQRKLIGPIWGRTHLAEFNMNSLMRANSTSRANFYNTMQSNGNMTINEVRGLENLNDIGPAGDQHFVPLNMTTAERMMVDDGGGTAIVPAGE